MDIENMTYGDLKKIAALFQGVSASSGSLNQMIGQKCIVRTYSAGVWFGEIAEKSGAEVIVKNARRMWQWKAAESISLSAVALHGINHEGSRIAEAVPAVWLEAIELMPCSQEAIKSIEAAKNAKAQ